MKRAVNLRLEENVIITLNQLLDFAGKLKKIMQTQCCKRSQLIKIQKILS